MTRKLRVSAAAMVRAGCRFVHGGPGPALRVHRVLNPDIQAPSSGAEALRFDIQAPGLSAGVLNAAVGALSFGDAVRGVDIEAHGATVSQFRALPPRR